MSGEEIGPQTQNETYTSDEGNSDYTKDGHFDGRGKENFLLQLYLRQV